MKYFATRLLIALGLAAPLAGAQALHSANQPPSIDVAAGFTTIHANAAPGDCGCFFMYGGDVQLSLNNSHGISGVLDYGQTVIGNANNGGHDIRLSTYLAGGRYRLPLKRHFTPYGQVLFGIGHSNTNFQIDQSSNGFALAGGGGLDYILSPRLSVRLVQAEYLLTHVPNGLNDRQNQLRLTAGIVLHFPRPK